MLPAGPDPPVMPEHDGYSDTGDAPFITGYWEESTAVSGLLWYTRPFTSRTRNADLMVLLVYLGHFEGFRTNSILRQLGLP